MINGKQCCQDAGPRKIRERDGAGWRGGEGLGQLFSSCGQDARGSSYCQGLRVTSGENDQGQFPCNWQKGRLTEDLPSSCLFLETLPWWDKA